MLLLSVLLIIHTLHYYHSSIFSGYIGLWKGCGFVDYMRNVTCVDLMEKNVNSRILLVRGFSVLAIIASCATIILACISIKNGHSIRDCGKGMVFVAGLGVVAGIVFVINIELWKDDMLTMMDQKYISYGFKYSWAFFLHWAGTSIAILTSLFAKNTVDLKAGSPDNENVWLFDKTLEGQENVENEFFIDFSKTSDN